MNTPGSKAALPSRALLTAIRRLLRPLARLLIARGVHYPALLPLLKEAYVDSASRDFRVARKRQTDSRIHFLSGVHRKDVKRIRAEGGPNTDVPKGISVGSQMVAVWLGDPLYLDQEGRPLPLPRFGQAEGGPSFEGLVESVSKDVRPRTVLDEWLRLEMIHLDDDDMAHLNQEAFTPSRDEEKMSYYFGRNLHDHMAAAVHNLQGEGVPFLERSVHYDRLSRESCEKLQALSEEAAMTALRTVNRAALELAKEDEGNVDAVHRINLGVYCFVADEKVERGEEEA
ncbi:MAG: hypothetical protein HQL50_05600 [Magnetococcales bacterium]|nr:hypothetical protein [Magnetococcales bacterium]